jgi:integrase/recombinase XerD
MTALQEYTSKKNNISLLVNMEASGAIQSYIQKCSKSKSKRTKTNYTSWFNNYFLVITGKDINNVTWNDIAKISYTHVVAYQGYLEDRGNCANSINKKLSAIETMLKFLSLKYPEQNINTQILNSIKAKVSKHEIKRHGLFKESEFRALLDYCNSDNVSYKPEMQKLFFETMFITALREDACLTLTTNQIKHIIDPESQNLIYIIQKVDKAKDREIAISDSLAERLLNARKNITKEEAVKDMRYNFAHNRIFTLSEKAVTKTLKQFCKANNIEEDRNISLHSVRNTTCNYALKQTHDIYKVQLLMGHANINTTADFYAEQMISYADQLSIVLHDKNISIDELSDLTKDELLMLISKAGNGIIKQLIDLKNKSK